MPQSGWKGKQKRVGSGSWDLRCKPPGAGPQDLFPGRVDGHLLPACRPHRGARLCVPTVTPLCASGSSSPLLTRSPVTQGVSSPGPRYTIITTLKPWSQVLSHRRSWGHHPAWDADCAVGSARDAARPAFPISVFPLFISSSLFSC